MHAHCWKLTHTGKAQAFNDLWELDTSDPDEYRWKELAVTGTLPPARGRHAAIQVRNAILQSILDLNCADNPGSFAQTGFFTRSFHYQYRLFTLLYDNETALHPAASCNKLSDMK